MKKIVLALMVTFLFIGCGGNTPKDVATKFAKAVYDGDFDTVSEMIYLPAEDLKNQPNLKQMFDGKIAITISSAKSKVDAVGGYTSIKATSESVDSNKAVVTVETVFKNGDKHSGDITLVKDKNGKWKIKM